MNKGKLFNMKGDSFIVARTNLEETLEQAFIEWEKINKDAKEKPLDGWMVLFLKDEWFKKWFGY